MVTHRSTLDSAKRSSRIAVVVAPPRGDHRAGIEGITEVGGCDSCSLYGVTGMRLPIVLDMVGELADGRQLMRMGESSEAASR